MDLHRKDVTKDFLLSAGFKEEGSTLLSSAWSKVERTGTLCGGDLGGSPKLEITREI